MRDHKKKPNDEKMQKSKMQLLLLQYCFGCRESEQCGKRQFNHKPYGSIRESFKQGE